MRWSDETERLLLAAADQIGVSKAQFIRESILIRAILVLEQDLPPAEELSLAREISDRVRRTAAELD